MRITEIRGYALEHEMAEPLCNAVGQIRLRTALFVEVIGENGQSGWGETQRCAVPAWETIESVFARRVIGRDTSEHAEIWAELDSLSGEPNHRLALSALDIALWDLRGRNEGCPVTALLGGRRRDRVTAYASGPFMKDGGNPYRDVVRDASGYLADNFTGVKVRCGIAPEADARILTELRRELGNTVALMIDINKGYNRRTARDLVRLCEPLGLQWIEEPLEPGDVTGYQGLSQASTIPIACGESLSRISDFKRFMAGRAVEVIQPDIYLCGGLTGAMQIASIAEHCGIPYVPHVFGAVINFRASLQLAAVLPAHHAPGGGEYPLFEFDRSDNPLRKLSGEWPVDTDGAVRVPDGPGVGVELTRDMLEPFVKHAWSIELDRIE
jgi:D-galactarolactone cycloisomerase